MHTHTSTAMPALPSFPAHRSAAENVSASLTVCVGISESSCVCEGTHVKVSRGTNLKHIGDARSLLGALVSGVLGRVVAVRDAVAAVQTSLLQQRRSDRQRGSGVHLHTITVT